jgi:hypothetical protein
LFALRIGLPRRTFFLPHSAFRLYVARQQVRLRGGFSLRFRHASILRFFPWTSRERPVYFGAPNPNISKGGFTAVKKLFASLLLLTLAVCLSAPSFAQDAAPKKDTATTAKGKAKTDDKMKTDDKATAPKGKAKGHKTDKMDKEKMDKEKTDKGAPKA